MDAKRYILWGVGLFVGGLAISYFFSLGRCSAQAPFLRGFCYAVFGY